MILRGRGIEWLFSLCCVGFLGLASDLLKGRSDSKLQKRQLKQERELAQLQTDRDNRLRSSQQERSQNFLTGAMDRFNQSTTGTPESVSRLQSLIREQALPEQQKAIAQGRVARQQQGVRGLDAAVLEQQQANALQKQLSQRAEQVALQQQLADRERRAQLAARQSEQALPGTIMGTDETAQDTNAALNKVLKRLMGAK